MDLITVVWYLSTFIALVAFFIVMACSDNHCGQERQRETESNAVTAPPTPAPSYREFAPPSYDTVMKKNKTRIFVVPIHGMDRNKDTEIVMPNETVNVNETVNTNTTELEVTIEITDDSVTTIR